MAMIDPPLLRNVRELVRPGDVVWDIGANIGLFTFAAAALSGVGGQVVAFEPDAWLVQLLKRSRALQSPETGSITIIPAAVASQIALRQFKIARRSRASNSLVEYGHSQTGGCLEEHTVPTFNLDWLMSNLPTPNVVKCDVEGAEIEVFEGQKKMLGEVRPIVVCEVGSESSQQMTKILQDYRYNIYDGEKPLAGSQAIHVACWDTVAIPEERSEEYVTLNGAR
jgi:FkbM family methyltransferase